MAEYVTVVSVDIHPKKTMMINPSIEPEKKSQFVTVLSINNNQNTTTISTSENPSNGEIVTVYRLAGERLGFGLKFQGGTKTNEKVQRLFIQSCDPDSPASKARASWGPLSEGDEVLEIDNVSVIEMTRIECVKCLKDRNVAINLRVKKHADISLKNGSETSVPKKRPLPPPPPTVPPRKINKKPIAREAPPMLPKIIAVETPVVAEMYLNVFDDEINHQNDESDETGSTISSQISVISNFSSESDMSMLSANANSNELTKILTKPFQMIEREFNVNSSADTSMSIDNLLMFNDSERLELKAESKPLSNYENVKSEEIEHRTYENAEIKVPPIPRPRSISLPQDSLSEIDAKTPAKAIESWLNDASTINGNGDKHVSSDEHEQNYEPIKFECFAAGDDEDDEKLGPPELINISEAYFNFPWCGNSSGNLSTIEEEFSSLEPNSVHKIIKGPIFIVNAVNDNEFDNETDSSLIFQRADKEINNNNSLNLHECEDKGDKTDKRMQCENNFSQSETFVTTGSSLVENSKENSFNEIFHQKAMEAELNIEVETIDNDESLMTMSSDQILIKLEKSNESDENDINNKEMITSDSERLEIQHEEGKQAGITTSNEPSINERKVEMTQSNEETTTESKDMTSLPTPNVQQFTREIQLEQMDRKATENSRMPPDGHEFPVNRLSKSVTSERQAKSDSDSIKSSPMPTTKATAIVAPLVPRKMQKYDEITNFVDTKPPFKSATMGRQRPINWRNKDEKSEKSVKDKIAMFSNSTSDISHILPKTTNKTSPNGMMTRKSSIAKSSENIFSSSSVKSKLNGSFKKKAMSVENLDAYEEDEDEVIETRQIEMSYRPISNIKSPSRPLTLNIGKAQSIDNLNLRPFESPMLPSRPPPTAPATSLSRRISFSGYTNNQMEESRKKSITNILDNRKKGMSKLRGLVIPEKVQENELSHSQKVLGLPVIRSKECDLINGSNLFSRSVSMPQSINVTPAKKSFEVQSQFRSAPRRSVAEMKNDFQAIKSPPIKPPRTSLIISSSSNKSNMTDDSDTESCLSSRVSSPPVSPVAKKPLTRTFSSETNTSISSNSTLTSGSGSQASCSSNGSPPGKSPEAVSNRKLILASSKSRSGRDCLEKSWRDEDSTDGGIDEDNRKRMPKAKARSSLVNYKVVAANDNLVDKIINVATYVEVVSSDTDDKPEASGASTTPAEKNASMKAESTKLNILSDMAKWVRSESKNVGATAKKAEARESVEKKTLLKVTEPLKNLNLSEIRKNFEIKSTAVSPVPKSTKEKPAANHNRFSSWDSIASSSSGVSSELLGTGTGTNNSESLQTLQSDFGSFSSFGSSHSLITPQDLQLIIDEADPPLETPDAFVIVLQRETPEMSIGITLAGGSDYEAKEITIHRILSNSPADKDGRLKRGDRLLSINGLSMRGLTHRESLSVLKSPRCDVVMVVTRSKSIIEKTSFTKTKRGSLGSLASLTEKSKTAEADSKETSLNSAKSMEMGLDAISNEDRSYQNNSDKSQNGHSTKASHDFKSGDIASYSIVKDGAGLGFSIDGGYDSPNGNKPLVIKKIFMGGAAERSSNLKVGDEIIEINGGSTEKRSRIDVWNMIKNLPMGDAVQLTIKRK